MLPITSGYFTTKSFLHGIHAIISSTPEAIYWPWTIEMPTSVIAGRFQDLPVMGYTVDRERKKVVLYGCKSTKPLRCEASNKAALDVIG